MGMTDVHKQSGPEGAVGTELGSGGGKVRAASKKLRQQSLVERRLAEIQAAITLAGGAHDVDEYQAADVSIGKLLETLFNNGIDLRVHFMGKDVSCGTPSVRAEEHVNSPANLERLRADIIRGVIDGVAPRDVKGERS